MTSLPKSANLEGPAEGGRVNGTVWMVMVALVTGGDDWAFPFPPLRFLAVVDEWDLRCRRFIRVADIITADGNQTRTRAAHRRLSRSHTVPTSEAAVAALLRPD